MIVEEEIWEKGKLVSHRNVLRPGLTDDEIVDLYNQVQQLDQRLKQAGI